MKNGRLWFVLIIGCISIGLTGCGQKSNDGTSTPSERQAFGAPPDPNKMSPEQRRMYDQFRHSSGNPATAHTPTTPQH